MGISYGFYNSINGDRKYNAGQMSSLFDGIINDGVFMSIGDSLMVTESTGMYVNVGTGRAWFNHTWTDNDSDILLLVSQSEVTLNRIDLVVLEVNSTEEVRANSIKIVTGTPGLNPVAPTPTNTQFIHQHKLAEIYVGSGVSEIVQANITNKVGSEDCPFITGILETMDTEALLAQWNDEFQIWLTSIQDLLSDSSDNIDTLVNQWTQDFNVWITGIEDLLTASSSNIDDMKAQWTAEFNDWFLTVVDTLDTDTAGNLYNIIVSNDQKLEQYQNRNIQNFRKIRGGATPR